MFDAPLKILVSAALGALPFYFQDTLPIWSWILCCVLLGAAAGYGLGFPAMGGGVIGTALALWLLTRYGVIGNGNEGDTHYLLSGWGAAAFVLSAMIGALLRGSWNGRAT
jgi:hypothetical protein